MRKLVVGTFLTLVGVMQSPGAPDEDSSGGFTHGGWVVPYFDDMMGQAMVEWIRRLDGLVLGRRTYEISAAHWPRVTADDPIADQLNRVPKYVALRTLKRADWSSATGLGGDVPEAISKLKDESGDGELQVPVLMARGHETGFGLLRGVAVNPHLTSASREGELVNVVDQHPDLPGIELEDSAGLLVVGDTAEVLGSGRGYLRRHTTRATPVLLAATWRSLQPQVASRARRRTIIDSAEARH